MKIKKWLIHKLGGLSKEEILPPTMYTVENLKVEKFGTYFIDKYSMVPEEYIIDTLAHNFLPMIKENIKITKEKNDYGEIYYQAEIRIVKGGVEWP